jgi:hypothetical protein
LTPDPSSKILLAPFRRRIYETLFRDENAS